MFLGLLFFLINFLDGQVNDQNGELLFTKFKVNYNKSYSSLPEEENRKEIFKDNLRTIMKHNLKYLVGSSTFKMGINQFADQTWKEISDFNGWKFGNSSKYVALSQHSVSDKYDNYLDEVPDSYDWRDHDNVVSSIKDQKTCGACYILSTLDALESQIFLKTGKRYNFSAQEILDCAGEHNAAGCYGGLTDSAYSYINEKKGISLAKNYPFTRKPGKCIEDIQRINVTIKGILFKHHGDENLLKKMIYYEGPVIASLDHMHESFYRYNGGIYDDPNCNGADYHQVVIVGYGSENGNDYWIVKNSFGKTFGENGYIRIARNNNNLCQISTENLVPILNLF